MLGPSRREKPPGAPVSRFTGPVTAYVRLAHHCQILHADHSSPLSRSPPRLTTRRTRVQHSLGERVSENEREETTQNTTVTRSAACASYITPTYTRASKRRWHGATAHTPIVAEVPSALRAMPFATARSNLALLCAKEIPKRWCSTLVKMKEKKLLKIRSLPKVLRAQAMRSTTQHTRSMVYM
jgi:hypothetical protein